MEGFVSLHKKVKSSNSFMGMKLLQQNLILVFKEFESFNFKAIPIRTRYINLL